MEGGFFFPNQMVFVQEKRGGKPGDCGREEVAGLFFRFGPRVEGWGEEEEGEERGEKKKSAC
jgi:hypothetical protein